MSRAIDLILKCIDPTNIFATDLGPAIDELKAEGDPGSDRLAALLRDFSDSRSEGAIYALQVAGHLKLTPALKAVLTDIVMADPVKNGPQGRYTPEIVGGGQIGWTDRTHQSVIALATKALEQPAI